MSLDGQEMFASWNFILVSKNLVQVMQLLFVVGLNVRSIVTGKRDKSQNGTIVTDNVSPIRVPRPIPVQESIGSVPSIRREPTVPDTPVSKGPGCKHKCKNKERYSTSLTILRCKHGCCKASIVSRRPPVERQPIPEHPRTLPNSVKERRDWQQWLSRYRLQPEPTPLPSHVTIHTKSSQIRQSKDVQESVVFAPFKLDMYGQLYFLGVVIARN